ncbi:methyl-accepting chemotaxis sensory transducer with Cache sensor [Bacteriovorax stolpii]|nr:cache domain-containing protein [Bacteriovorax stolpii]TDP54049.1 methyl-accepting chemotaxis sensory transducer with Cache sensor [Bacteriovorax stolpii]
MFLFNWMRSKSIRFRIFSLIAFLLLPVCILVQFFILPTFEDKIYEGKRETTRYAVELAIGTISKFYQDFKDNKITEAVAKEEALKAIKALRYNEKEYFWINDMKPTMIMHPINEKLINQDLSAKKDANGKLLFVDMTEIVKKDKAGYLKYYWERPGETVPVPKISYVKGFEPWGWVVGTGVYVDDVVAEVRAVTIKVWTVLASVLAIAVILVTLFSGYLTKTLITVSSKINHGAQAFRDSSTSINASSLEVSSRTDTSAAALQQTSASLEEISSMIKKSSDNMATLQTIAQTSKSNVNVGKKSLQEMMESLNTINENNKNINQQVENSNNDIANIVNLIHEISDKTKIINDIVFQTKLLSFNASVEAARAGENGKGFAVVAEEVGNLATMSGKASEEISQILSKSTNRVQEIVTKTKANIAPLMDASVKNLNHGFGIAEDCSKTFDLIVTDSETINSMVGETFVAFKEQNIAVEEITKAVTDLDLLTQQNAQSAKSNVEHAESLTKEANDLGEVTAELTYIINGRAS